MRLPRTATTFSPPVMEARRWIEGVDFPPDRPLMNVSQAAPVDPPPAPLRQAMADIALTRDDAHLYGPVLGLPALREELAQTTTRIYQGEVTADEVAITSGCNQAFAAAIAAICAEGDEVLVPTPWYFNHKMWLDMAGVTAAPLPTGDDMLPKLDQAQIGPKAKAIVLVSPNNPSGVEYPAELILAAFKKAQAAGIKLILDETYRDFHAVDGPPHPVFQQPNWQDTLIHLYSFSKAYRLTGHRVGALITSASLQSEVEKFLDTVAICAGQIGQHAALWGMQNLSDWLAGERAELLRRRAAIQEHLPKLQALGWELLGLGGYFAYMRHPFAETSGTLAPRLVKDASILCLPGTMFYPDGDARAPHELRLAFANLDVAGIATLFERLSTVELPRR